MKQQNIVSMEWLKERLNDKEIVVVDCRFLLSDPEAGRVQYMKAHIPGAFYLDLDQDLSAPVERHGGRHPLPDMNVLAVKLGSLGIDAFTHVVAYDDQGGSMAARLWWLLQYMGHSGGASVMDAGYSAWVEAGYPVTDTVPANPEAKALIAHLKPELLASMEEVREKIGAADVLIIDSREAPRYLGEVEPIDSAAGHIPSAVNLFWKDGLNEQGKWCSAAEHQQRFASRGADSKKEIIVYCGSGVTACPNILALQEAGYTNVKLYAGSWSDWISYRENPIATGEE